MLWHIRPKPEGRRSISYGAPYAELGASFKITVVSDLSTLDPRTALLRRGCWGNEDEIDSTVGVAEAQRMYRFALTSKTTRLLEYGRTPTNWPPVSFRSQSQRRNQDRRGYEPQNLHSCDKNRYCGGHRMELYALAGCS